MVESEQALLEAFIEAVRALDPDMLVGWEVQQGSIGYLIDRATLLEIPLLRAISRTPEVRPAARDIELFIGLSIRGRRSSD